MAVFPAAVFTGNGSPSSRRLAGSASILLLSFFLALDLDDLVAHREARVWRRRDHREPLVHLRAQATRSSSPIRNWSPR